MARICTAAGVKWLGVVSLDEALTLRTQGIRCNILVLSFYHPDKIAEAIKKNIRLTVYSARAAKKINTIAARLDRKASVHVKIDTGTTRLGLLPDQVIGEVKQIAALPHIRLEGAFTHYADAENPDQVVTHRQHSIFTEAITALQAHGISIPITHSACSAATLLNPKTHDDMVRVGISLYGLWSVESPRHRRALQKKLPLKPVLSWHTRIIQVKDIPQGAHIGYGQTYRASQPLRIAVLPIGYWDGYDRGLSNIAVVVINGVRCPVRGRICMNLTMVDVTEVPRVRPGDTATVIGYNKKAEVSADEVARWLDTINYEVVTRINPLIPRIVTK